MTREFGAEKHAICDFRKFNLIRVDLEKIKLLGFISGGAKFIYLHSCFKVLFVFGDRLQNTR